MNTRPTISRIALDHPRSTGAERPRASSDFSSMSSLARATVHIILNINRGVVGCSSDAGGPYWTKQRIRGHLTPVRYSFLLRCILSVKPRTCPTQRRTVTGSTCLFSRDCCLPSPSCWSSCAHDPLTIREARQHLLRTHGIRISRATSWREFMADATQVTTVWCGALAQRGAAVAWIFSVESVDRMAVAFRSRRVEAQPSSESLSFAVTRFGERRPAKKRSPSLPTAQPVGVAALGKEWTDRPATYASLVPFARLLMRVGTAVASRAYASYGGINIVASLAWLWAVESVRPD